MIGLNQKALSMSFFIRLFSQKQNYISQLFLNSTFGNLPEFNYFTFELEKTSTHNQIIVKKKGSDFLIILELNPANKNADKNKLTAIINTVKYKKPENASKWIQKYLKKTDHIYEFIPLPGMESEKDWNLLSKIYTEFWVYTRGVFQIQNEGFTNESGDLILWDMPFTAAGKRICAVKSFTNRWKTFEMNLESPAQRSAFFKGQVPKNSKLIYRG